MTKHEFGDVIYYEGSTTGHALDVRHGYGNVITTEPGKNGSFASGSGPALRDALIKAFPLEDEKSEPAPEKTAVDPDTEFDARVEAALQRIAHRRNVDFFRRQAAAGVTFVPTPSSPYLYI